MENVSVVFAENKITLATLAIFLVGIWSLSFYISRMLREYGGTARETAVLSRRSGCESDQPGN